MALYIYVDTIQGMSFCPRCVSRENLLKLANKTLCVFLFDTKDLPGQRSEKKDYFDSVASGFLFQWVFFFKNILLEIEDKSDQFEIMFFKENYCL